MFSSYYTGKEVLGCMYVFFEEMNQTINGNKSEKYLWLLHVREALLGHLHLNNSTMRVENFREDIWLEATITNFAVLVKQTNGKLSKRKPVFNFLFYFWWYSSYFRDECCLWSVLKIEIEPRHGFKSTFYSRIDYVFLTCHPA